MRSRIARAALPLLDLLLPSDCFVCGRPLGAHQACGACLRCWTALSPLRGPQCRSCGIPLPAGTDLLGPAAAPCGTCLHRPLPVDGARAAVLYDRVARRLLLRAKLARRREILALLGAQLARSIAASGAPRVDRVAFVPSHPWTRLRRGFDPAREIARPVSQALDSPLASLLARRLSWPRATKRMPARERRRAVNRAFRARGACHGLRVLLVDDVLTTGATARACALALRSAGAREVHLATWARTPRLVV